MAMVHESLYQSDRFDNMAETEGTPAGSHTVNLKLQLAAGDSRIFITVLYDGGSIHKMLNPEKPMTGADRVTLELELIDVLTEQIEGKTQICVEFDSAKKQKPK